MATTPGSRRPSSEGSLPRSPSPVGDQASSSAPQRVGTIHLTPHSGGQTSRPTGGSSDQGSGHQHGWSQDPRSSSQQSLLPARSASESGQRTLLLIYIHGFLGNEMSFQSFPAHVHNLLTVTLAESHVVHTKIYPRYKSRRVIEFARDSFSEWITPHESPDTDIILLGHSMGGILSAEVVLLAPPTYPAAERFRHRILGIINFDTPFIGMHPGVIVSGLSSLFRPGSDSPKPTPHVDTQSPYPAFAGNQASADSPSYQTGQDCMTSTATSPEYAESSTALSTMSTAHSNSTTDTLSPFASPTQIDPNYNPPFPNDIRVPKRAGLNNAVHFVTKHSDGLTKATRQYVTSHLEFTGCLADYPGLRRRYGAIRALEDIDDIHFRPSVNLSMQPRRVRFVNYYTASTGRVRKSKLPSSRSDGIGPASPADLSIVSSRQSIRSASRSPRISVEEHRDDVVVPRPLDEPDEAPDDLRGVENTLEDGLFDIEELKKSTTQGSRSPPTGAGVSPTAKRESSDLPEIPSLPREPHFFDPSQYTDRETLRRAEKEHGRLLKTYKQAVKDRDRVLRDREKTIARQSKRARQDWARGVKAAAKKLEVEAKQRLRAERQALNQPYVLNPEALNDTGFSPDGDVGGPTTRTKKDKKFCMLPPKINGRVDPTWIRVYMEGVDEVGAHCGLFFLGEAYEKLVGDVAMRMEEWVRDDETRRLVRKMEGLEM